MEYMGGKEFWHQRFAARSDAPMQPEAILVEDMKKMQTGPHLLDLACGDGRNALYLAQLGMQVEAVSYTHLDVYKRQGSGSAERCSCRRRTDR